MATNITEEQRKSHAYKKIGLAVEDMDSGIGGISRSISAGGVRVVYVKPHSLADDFGIQAGDIITSYGDETVKDSKQFDKLIKKADLDEGIMLTLRNKFGKRRVILKNY